MTDPDQLKRQRGGHRSVATRRMKEAEDAFANPTSVDALRLEQLKRELMSTRISLSFILSVVENPLQ